MNASLTKNHISSPSDVSVFDNNDLRRRIMVRCCTIAADEETLPHWPMSYKFTAPFGEMRLCA